MCTLIGLLGLLALVGCGEATQHPTAPGAVQAASGASAPGCLGSGYSLFDEYAPDAQGAPDAETLAASYAGSGETIFWVEQSNKMATAVIGTPPEGRIQLTMHMTPNGWLPDGVHDC